MYDPRVITDIKRVKRDAVEPEKFDRLMQVIEARNGHKLLGAVEQAKIDLSDAESTTLPLINLVDVSDPVLTRRSLEDAIGTSVHRVTACLRNTLADAGVSREEINAVFLTGGSSRLPLLRAGVQNVFPGAALIDGDTFGSVATGLTMDAHNKFGG